MAGELSITLMDFPEIIQGIRPIGKTKVPTEVPPILQAAFGLTTAGIAEGVPFYKIDIVSIFGKIGILPANLPPLRSEAHRPCSGSPQIHPNFIRDDA